MALIFAKLAADLHRHPKARRAGYHGTNVFRLALELNALHGATGRIPASYSEPYYLADALMCSEAEAEAGIAAAVRAKLLELAEDGCLVIVGWDEDEWGRGRLKAPDTGAERQARYRERTRARDAEVTLSVTRNVTSDVEVTRSDAVTTESEIRDQSQIQSQRSESLGKSRTQARDPAVPTAVPTPIESPPSLGELAPMVEHAVRRLDAARAKLDPSARKIGTSFHLRATDRTLLVARLRETSAPERQAVLDHCLDVLVAHASQRGDVGELRIGALCGERAWERWRLSTVESITSAARDQAPARKASGRPLTGIAAWKARQKGPP